jgi:putative IMPACT (imprinted ancient) family translation regulator
MLAVLQGRELFNIMAVVTRHFGGTKLGVGGLMRAYGGAVAKSLDRAELITVTPKRPLWLQYQYEDTNRIQAALTSLNLQCIESDYSDHVRSLIEIPDQEWHRVRQELIDQSAGRIRFQDSRAQ